ncbi:MAG: hypothetical protein MET45_11310 [Nostoc sp. LLA-1]|nr:hypothetical protein [Cyanocohniella sp. LLY]
MVTFKSGFSPAKTLNGGLNKLTFLRYQIVKTRKISLTFEVQGENINTTEEYEMTFDFIYEKDDILARILKNMGFTEPEMKYLIIEDMLQLDNTGIGLEIMKFLGTQRGVPFLAKLVDENNDGCWGLEVKTLRPLYPNK